MADKKIKDLLNSYKKTSAKRIAKQKRKDEKWDNLEKRRKQFEADAKKEIVGNVRRVMKKLLGNLNKSDFKISIVEFGTNERPKESYKIEGIKEKDLELSFIIGLEEEEEMMYVYTGYAVDENTLHQSQKKYRLNQLTEKLITEKFIKGLEKICL